MNCSEIREELSLYIDDMLDPDKKKEIERHLNGCSDCRKEYDELREVTMLLHEIPDTPLPESFDAALKIAIKNEKKAVASKKRLKTVSGIAAVFVIGIFSVTMYNNIGDAGGSIPMQGTKTAQYAAIDDADMTDFAAAYDMAGEAASGQEKTKEEAEIPAGPESGLTSGQVALNSGEEQRSAAPIQNEISEFAMDSGSIVEDAPVLRGPGRSIDGVTTDSAIEQKAKSDRDKIIVRHYIKLLEEGLKNLDYKITDYWKTDDIWYFNVEINTVNEIGEAVIEIDIYAGQDGKIWITESSLSMGTVY